MDFCPEDYMNRLMIFIDGSNLYHGIKNFGRKISINFHKFQKMLVARRKLIRTYYYNVETPELKEQLKFYKELESIENFKIILGRLEKRKGGHKVEKGIDIKIATDMLKHALMDNYDVAILVTGDGDFVPVIEEIQEAGKIIENAYFVKGSSNLLKTACDKYIKIDSNFLKKCTFR